MNPHDLSAYHYDLPSDLIASQPVHPRDASRLLVMDRKTGRWEHRMFRDLPEYLDQNDLVVANNTKVLKARLLGHRIRPASSPKKGGEMERGGKVEFVLLEELKPRVWEGLFHASAKYVPGFQFEIPTPDGKNLRGELIRGARESATGTVVAEFDRDPIESGAGVIPLPHYLHRDADQGDEKDYQTLYASRLGSAAAPTAGLHFSEEVLNDLRSKGVRWREITLHVGLGTFRPVKVTDIREHVMHEERYEVAPELVEEIRTWRREGKRVCAIGTTSVRTLESAWLNGQNQGKTSLFIRPGAHQFQVVDRMLTNFHLPGSTLLMLVSAFAGSDRAENHRDGREWILAAYREAIQKRYRFFSYGDAMLIL